MIFLRGAIAQAFSWTLIEFRDGLRNGELLAQMRNAGFTTLNSTLNCNKMYYPLKQALRGIVWVKTARFEGCGGWF